LVYARRGWSYWPVITHPTLRRLLPGMAVSYLGDGISVIAVVLLAQELTGNAALVGLAVTMSTLPGAVGALTLRRWLSGWSGADLARWDATWRFAVLGAIPLAYAAGLLSITLYIVLLAASSILHSWGSAGRYSLIAEALPDRDRLAGNALLSILGEIGTIAGPPVAALILVFWNPAGALAVDALTFGVLALSYWFVPATPVIPPQREHTGFAVIHGSPALLGLLTLSAAFFFLFGPVYVALPTLVEASDGGASLLAAYYTTFGIGAVLGGLVTPLLGGLPRWWVTAGAVLIAGLCLLPLGVGAPTPVSIGGFALMGASWGPYQATSMALYQRISRPGQLPQVLASASAVALLTGPAGVAVGGLLVAGWGARTTLLTCAIVLIGVALTAALLSGRQMDAPGAERTSAVDA
jgi:DHA3 family macrolide efflux protein-like MFS transporter